MPGKIVVAMSGGVDSSVAAALLQAQGAEVIGIGLRFPELVQAAAAKTCCGMAGMEDARCVASALGIPFYVLDYRELFEQHVIAPFCRAYARGETPNPCIECNIQLKFGALLDLALSMGAEGIATGHYARLQHDAQGPQLLKGLDEAHDQSYFLYGLTPRQLAHTCFPVGELTKPQVRRIAADLGLPVAEKPGSQDICFVGPGGYRALVAERYPEASQPGPILDRAGRLLGRHRGLAGFTLGQRKGLGIAARQPLYVTALDAVRQAVIVGPREETLAPTLMVEQVHWLDGRPAATPCLAVKTRYRGPTSLAEVRQQGEQACVAWVLPQPRVAPGQAVVFYDGARVLGGGVASAQR